MALITFVVAFCSIAYELILSAIASILLGGTFYRYMTTIGLYIFCLGLGSIFVGRFRTENRLKHLFKIEISLSLLGALAIILPLFVDGLSDGHSNLLITWVVYAMVVSIGILSGMELPLLMALAEEEQERGHIRALAIDFLATFLGIVLFPAVLLPLLGIFNSAIIVSSLNALVVWRLYFMYKKKHTVWVLGFTFLFLILGYINIFMSQYLVDRVFS